MTWEYKLTPAEEAICVEVGYQRQKPYFGNPTKNISYSEGDLDELWQHAVCAGSELAFARMMGNTDFVPHYNKWKSELDLPGFGEIRYTFNEKRGLRFTSRDSVSKKYVLLRGGLAVAARRDPADGYKSPPYIAVGWMYGKDCVNPEWLYKEERGVRVWYVPPSELRDMDEVNS